MSTQSPEAFKKHIRGYILVFVALLVLTVATVWVSFWKVTVPVGIAIALLIACTKGTLVVSVFMHLRSEKPLILFCMLSTMIILLSVLLLPVATSLLTMTHNAG